MLPPNEYLDILVADRDFFRRFSFTCLPLTEGNRNAGISYNKVTAAIKEMKVEITAENAMSFSKGKTKVAGIGKSSAEKMKEFCATGSIEKLEEKRAANA